MFPRFLSEFMASTFLGIAAQLVGIFQNVKTIRMFQKKFARKINGLIESERRTLALTRETVPIWDLKMWGMFFFSSYRWRNCDSSLRVPHPFEYLIPSSTSSLRVPHPFEYLIPSSTSSLRVPQHIQSGESHNVDIQSTRQKSHRAYRARADTDTTMLCFNQTVGIPWISASSIVTTASSSSGGSGAASGDAVCARGVPRRQSQALF